MLPLISISSVIGQLRDNSAEIIGGALLVVALALFVAEFFAPTHGSIAVGGLVILIVGLIVLAQASESAVPTILIIALGLALVGFGALVVFEVVMARDRPVTTGTSGLENETGVVRDPLTPTGTVFVHGERWRAVTADGATLPVGTPVRILDVQNLTLIVQQATETETTLPPIPGAYDEASPSIQRSSP